MLRHAIERVHTRVCIQCQSATPPLCSRFVRRRRLVVGLLGLFLFDDDTNHTLITPIACARVPVFYDNYNTIYY